MSVVYLSSLGAKEVAAGFLAAGPKSDIAVKAVVRKHTALLNTRIKARASGRPGPNAPTGDYRRSWATKYWDFPGLYSGAAGTNKPQGRRLELGFVGTDSLGRHYNQPPYPHVGPAFEQTQPEFLKELGQKGFGL